MLDYLALVTQKVVGSYNFQQRSHPVYKSHSAGKVAGVHGFCSKWRCFLIATLIFCVSLICTCLLCFLEM